jgi:hypothetical protein
MTKAPFQAHSLTTLGLKKPGQVNLLLTSDDFFVDSRANLRIFSQ